MLAWTSAAVASEVRGARGLISSYAHDAGFDEELTQSVALAVTEALNNAVMHAFPGWPEGEGQIWLEADTVDGELVVRVIDNGVGMRERDDSPGAGLGLVIIDQVARASSTTFKTPGGTTLTMRFAADGG